MEIHNIFQQNHIAPLAQKIYALIDAEPNLTTRSLKEITQLISHNNIFVAFDKNYLCGFIIREPIYKEWFELKSWFVVPTHRNRGTGILLFRSACTKGTHYLGVTFQDNISTLVQRYGFKKASFSELPFQVKVRFILSRHISSILHHFRDTRSTLLIKL